MAGLRLAIIVDPLEKMHPDKDTTFVDQEIRVRSALAEMHYRKKDHERALDQLNALLDMDKMRSNDYYNRAEVYRALGRASEASADYGRFISSSNLPPGHEKLVRAHAFKNRNP